jgi:hypothetical protein
MIWVGTNVRFVPRLIPKLSSQKRVAQLAKQSEYVVPAKYGLNALNTHSRMTSALVFGVAYLNVSVVA